MFKDEAMVAQVSFSVKVEGLSVSLILHQLWNLLMQSHETSLVHWAKYNGFSQG
jgi:hypothetical protein